MSADTDIPDPSKPPPHPVIGLSISGIRKLLLDLFKNVYGRIIGAIVGASIAILAFLITRPPSNFEAVESSLTDQIISGIDRVTPAITYTRVRPLYYKLIPDVLLQTNNVLSFGELIDSECRGDDCWPSNYVALFGPGDPNWLDAAVGRKGAFKLKALVAGGALLRPTNVTLIDLNGDGQSEIVLEQKHVPYGRYALAPLVLARTGTDWKFFALPSIALKAAAWFGNAIESRDIPVTDDLADRLEMPKSSVSRVSPKVELLVEGGTTSTLDGPLYIELYIGGSYRIYQENWFDYPIVYTMALFDDDCLSCDHHVFMEIYNFSDNGWSPELALNGGHGPDFSNAPPPSQSNIEWLRCDLLKALTTDGMINLGTNRLPAGNDPCATN